MRSLPPCSFEPPGGPWQAARSLGLVGVSPSNRSILAATVACVAVSVASSCGGGTTRPDGGEPDAGVSVPNEEGEACAGEGTLVCGRKGSGAVDNVALYCGGGFLQSVFECPGSEACANIAGHDQIRCGEPPGTYFAKEGAACGNEASQACSFDLRVVLKCTRGTWETAINCPPTTCANVAQAGARCSGTWCANCGYGLGDTCGLPAEAVACSTDLSKIVQCSDGTIAVWRDCGSGTCTYVDPGGAATLECR
jgi:hypothetical protein